MSEELDKTNALIEVPGTKIRYYPLKNIGQGATSTVHLGCFGDSHCETPAAIKLVKQEHTKILKNELEIWKLLFGDRTVSSNHVVKLFDWGQYETSQITTNVAEREIMFVLAMEPANYNLRNYISTYPLESSYNIKSLCFDVANGLKFLHMNQILHRDVKPENVLIFQTGQNTTAKLGDFGISSTINLGTTRTTAHGTELWMSPEALFSLHRGVKFKNTKSVDIFSLGLTMYFALSKGQHPFSYSEKHGSFPEMNIKDPKVIPSRLALQPNFTEMDLLEWMMLKDPNKRPSIDQILLHPIFWSKYKCLDFICFIARKTNDKSDANCQQLRDEIEKEFQDFYQSISLVGTEFEWKSSIDERLFDRKGNGKKRYRDNMIFSLIELIRDKREHHCDMVENLIKERFSHEGSFSEEKYIEYFMSLFPYLMKFLFSSFIKRRDMFKTNICQLDSNDFERTLNASLEIGNNSVGNNDSDKRMNPDSRNGELRPETNLFNETKFHHDLWDEDDYNTWDQQQDDYDQQNDLDEQDYYDQQRQDDYDESDDYDPRDDYSEPDDQQDEYDPRDDYDPRDEYDPRDDYEEPDDPQDDYDPRDDYDEPDDQQDDYDPRDDYEEPDDPQDDYDPRDYYDEPDDPQDDYDPRDDYDEPDEYDSRDDNDPWDDYDEQVACQQQQLEDAIWQEKYMFQETKAFQKFFDQLCDMNFQFDHKSVLIFKKIYILLTTENFKYSFDKTDMIYHDHWAAVLNENWYEAESSQWYNNVY